MNIDNFYFMYNINALPSHNCSEAASEGLCLLRIRKNFHALLPKVFRNPNLSEQWP